MARVLRMCPWLRSPALSFHARVPTARVPHVKLNSTGRVGAMASTEAGEDVAVVFCTVPDKETGRKIASELLSQKLVACVNMIPGVESMYTWEGKMEVSEELILKIKTRRSLVPQLSTAIGSLHPYDVPEVIAVPVVGGGQSYLSWVEENTISAT